MSAIERTKRERELKALRESGATKEQLAAWISDGRVGARKVGQYDEDDRRFYNVWSPVVKGVAFAADTLSGFCETREEAIAEARRIRDHQRRVANRGSKS